MCEDEGEVRATMRLEPYPYSTGTERFRLYSRPISEEDDGCVQCVWVRACVRIKPWMDVGKSKQQTTRG